MVQIRARLSPTAVEHFDDFDTTEFVAALRKSEATPAVLE
ncbi:hypothetical protein PMI07_000699 [Rhizobium sp. CF080]|nr:hypothetical protein PMI07_000699 [Rhizobium sp. CF080]